MALIDIKEIEKIARNEVVEEAKKVAVCKLKELYQKKEKATLVVKNIEREIQSYLNEVSDLTIYESAGIDTSKS